MLSKKLLEILGNRQRYGAWMKKAMTAGAMAVIMGMSVMGTADAENKAITTADGTRIGFFNTETKVVTFEGVGVSYVSDSHDSKAGLFYNHDDNSNCSITGADGTDMIMRTKDSHISNGTNDIIIGGWSNTITGVNNSSIFNSTDSFISNQHWGMILGSTKTYITERAGKSGHSTALNVQDSNIKGMFDTVAGSAYVEAKGDGATVIGAYSKYLYNESIRNKGTNIEKFPIQANGNYSTIIGANADAKDSFVIANGNYSTILGVEASGGKTVEAGAYSAIIGGKDSSAKGSNSVVLAGDNSHADVKDALAFGANTSVTEVGGVALGAGSVANTKAGIKGYDPAAPATNDQTTSNNQTADNGIAAQAEGDANDAGTASDPVWTSQAAAVSVGDVDNGITRQITGVAAGTEDTDAVNVAQLKKAMKNAQVEVKVSRPVEVATNPSTNEYTISVNGKDIGKIQDRDTQLVGGEIKGVATSDYGYDFTFQDTSDNKVILKDVVTGAKLKELIDTGAIGEDDTDTSIESFTASELSADGKVTLTIQEKTLDPNVKPDAHTVTISNIASKDDISELQTNINNVDNRVTKVEGDVTNLDNRVTKVEGDVTNLDNRVTTVEGDVTNINNTIGDVNNIDSDIKGDTIVETINNLNQKTVSGVTEELEKMNNNINKLGNRVNKVGARSAALAALHPMDFDPDDKLTFAAGYGNYKGENAAAIGAFYRPDEKVMFSVAGTISDHDNMVNAGVSFSLDRTARVTNGKTAMAKDLLDLTAKVNLLIKENNRMKDALREATKNGGRVNIEFPDLPKDHWAYSYVQELAELGYIIGYPDGEFKGDRLLTRYEFATALYRALMNGAPVDGKMGKGMSEFKEELDNVAKAARFRVDRISGEDNDYRKVERVRVNGGEEKDKYGSKIEVAAK